MWIHAVSVGEVLIAYKLIREMRRREPGLDVVLSTTTSTGFTLANEKAKNAGEGSAVVVIYNPVDFRLNVRRVMRRIDPRMLVLVEAEVWPNLVARAKKTGVPVSLINARLSDRSERRYRKVAAVVKPIFSLLDHALVQDEGDVDRIAMLGVRRECIECVGSVKFDPQGAEPPKEQVEEFRQLLSSSFADRLAGQKLILAGSTHDGEEALIGEVYQQLKKRRGDVFYIVVPRHFERAPAVKAQLEALGLNPALRSSLAGDKCSSEIDCLVVDSTGELNAWYYLADIVVIGKSFLSTGGQNPVEAVLAEKPVLFGPHMENFRALVRMFETAGGTRQVSDVAELEAAIQELLEKPDVVEKMVREANKVLAGHNGATQRTAEILLRK